MSLFESEMPPGLIYIPNWLNGLEHDRILDLVDNSEFDTTLSRRVQHYGARYNYESSSVEEIRTAPSVPHELHLLCERLVSEGFFQRLPEQIIVNEYIGNQGIASHVDRTSFGSAIATVSLIESWTMKFRSPNADVVEVPLEKCSLAVMTGPARYEWTHEIAKKKNENIAGMRMPRGRRVSLTFRTIGV